MAPEVIADAVEQPYLAAIDMWSVGVILQLCQSLAVYYISIPFLQMLPYNDQEDPKQGSAVAQVYSLHRRLPGPTGGDADFGHQKP